MTKREPGQDQQQQQQQPEQEIQGDILQKVRQLNEQQQQQEQEQQQQEQQQNLKITHVFHEPNWTVRKINGRHLVLDFVRVDWWREEEQQFPLRPLKRRFELGEQWFRLRSFSSSSSSSSSSSKNKNDPAGEEETKKDEDFRRKREQTSKKDQKEEEQEREGEVVITYGNTRYHYDACDRVAIPQELVTCVYDGTVECNEREGYYSALFLIAYRYGVYPLDLTPPY